MIEDTGAFHRHCRVKIFPAMIVKQGDLESEHRITSSTAQPTPHTCTGFVALVIKTHFRKLWGILFFTA